MLKLLKEILAIWTDSSPKEQVAEVKEEPLFKTPRMKKVDFYV